MNISIPKFIYILTDGILRLFVNIFVSSEAISRRLHFERVKIFNDRPMDYAMKTLGTIHDRASSMVAHLSLMLALCMFTVQSKRIVAGSAEYYIVIADALIYMLLVILSIRALRSFGLDKDYKNKDEYLSKIDSELTYKYQIMELVNSVTIIATITLVIALGLAFGK